MNRNIWPARLMTTLTATLLAVCLAVVQTEAQEVVSEEEAEDTSDLNASIDESEKLSSFTALAGPIRLRNASSEVDIFVPVSPAVELLDAVLTLEYLNSIALLSERSTLIVRLNEATIAQVPLSAERPKGSARIRLPSQLWQTGFNKITLGVTQHYTDRCEDPQAPELWTELDIALSELKVSYRYADMDYGVSDLSAMVAPGFGDFGEITLVTSGSNDQKIVEQALPIVVQAMALRRGYLPLVVTTTNIASPEAPQQTIQSAQMAVDEAEEDSNFTIFVATVEDLTGELDPFEIDRITGPTLMVRGNNGEVELFVTGRNDEEVVGAARGLSLIDDQLNPGSFVTFSLDDVAQVPPMRRDELAAGQNYTFSSLGVDTQTLGGNGLSEVIIPIRVPPDFYTYEGAEGELLLNFNYTAGMGPGSIFGVSINDEFIHGLALTAENGTAFRDYRIVVPGRLLRPGYNEITLGFDMRPIMSGGECTSVRGQNINAQVVGDSEFKMPPGGSAVVLPDLALLADSGMPFSASSLDGEVVDFYAASPELHGAGLALIGKIAQTAGVVDPNIHLKTGIPTTTTRNAFIIAPQRDVPLQLFGDWPVEVGETSRWPYSTLRNLNSQSATSNELELDRIIPILLGNEPYAVTQNRETLSTFRQRGNLGNIGILAAFRNPWSEEFRTIAVLSASDTDRLIESANSLISPGVWGQMRGDFFSWNPENQVFATFVSRPEVVAPDDFWLRIRLILSQAPQLWFFAALAAVAIFVLSATLLIRRRIRRLAEVG